MKLCAKNLCKILLSVLFLLLFSGPSLAQNVGTDDLQNLAVTGPKIAPMSVGENKIKNNAVTSDKL